MPRTFEDKFARLLTEGVRQISLREAKTIRAVQDELGYALGRGGGSVIEYWRKGHLPPTPADVTLLAREIVRRGRVGPDWLDQFLCSAGYLNPADLRAELFPSLSPPKPPVEPFSAEPSEDNGLYTGVTAPFIVGPPILYPRNFFGREYELERLFNLWKQPPLQNAAVIGPKRSGKTSLLHYLKAIPTTPPAQLRPGQKTNWLPHPERYRWVVVDFQDSRMRSQERLLRHLLTHLQLPSPTPCDLHRFMDIVSHDLHAPAIILMDEIGAALASPELDQDFWWNLRSLQCNQTAGRLAFVLASHQSPILLAQEQGKPSPFFNIFGHAFMLGPLNDVEARELIASSPWPFDPADVEWILEHSGRWPCLVQILCHARLAARPHSQAGAAWQKEGLRQAAPFRYLLSQAA